MTENNQQKEEGVIDKILKESKDMDINFEKIINQGDQQNKNDGFEILKKEKDDSSQILPEVDVRVVSPEIIEILDKDIFKKYRDGNNLRKIKVNTEENFLENQTLINMADLLGIKKITFKEINSNTFNSLLSRKSYMVKKSNKIKEDKINKKEKADKGETENEINDETYLEEIVFDNCQMDIDYSKFFPLVKKFTLKNCKVPYNISTDLNFNFLTNLSLENIGLIDENCQSLFYQIRSNKFLKNNLKYISLKNNNIGLLDPCKGIDDNEIDSVLGLNNLEIFDLSNNKIFFVSTKMLNTLKNIKLINLTNNGIVFPSRYSAYLSAGKKFIFLVLLTKNYALLSDHNKEEYINYLFNIIPKLDYNINTISLINLYTGRFYEKMKTLNLSKFNNSLIELDISYGNINDTDLYNLFKGNLALFNLKILNLEKNKISEILIDLFTEPNFVEQFKNLKMLYLSSNQIHFKKAVNYQNFFEKFKNLKLLELKHTPFELSLNNYTRTIINRHYENERYKQFKTNFTQEDLEIQKIVENDKYLVKNTKVHINVYDTNNHKYVSKIKKFYPEILDRIHFEQRFIENK